MRALINLRPKSMVWLPASVDVFRCEKRETRPSKPAGLPQTSGSGMTRAGVHLPSTGGRGFIPGPLPYF